MIWFDVRAEGFEVASLVLLPALEPIRRVALDLPDLFHKVDQSIVHLLREQLNVLQHIEHLAEVRVVEPGHVVERGH